MLTTNGKIRSPCPSAEGSKGGKTTLSNRVGITWSGRWRIRRGGSRYLIFASKKPQHRLHGVNQDNGLYMQIEGFSQALRLISALAVAMHAAAARDSVDSPIPLGLIIAAK